MPSVTVAFWQVNNSFCILNVPRCKGYSLAVRHSTASILQVDILIVLEEAVSVADAFRVAGTIGISGR